MLFMPITVCGLQYYTYRPCAFYLLVFPDFMPIFNLRITVAAGLVAKERSRRLSTATLNQVVSEAVAFKPPPRTRGGKRGRIYYCTQVLIGFFSCLHGTITWMIFLLWVHSLLWKKGMKFFHHFPAYVAWIIFLLNN